MLARRAFLAALALAGVAHARTGTPEWWFGPRTRTGSSVPMAAGGCLRATAT